ncbi:MAG: tetratricopeptide repeat protein [Nitrospinaceae bacterium]|nr:tetratricopeptide repeat protein [Nitrospinaceae bacterium]NIR57369.1 tetratricopeptide repeat protein [Nitrospinaceae bacterium]NIS87821.1 tetratricopeptide repeat protein [Nitrospinaceae bacterium]NIT84691.1 tetratricopeptide repeat protein [Nitrospinaceae bacterium]NIU46870.1 tetratricopeptide repeat protein [Nitrospinaceae bacterium]
MPWSSSADDEDLFFEEDFGSEFQKEEEEKTATSTQTTEEEDNFFKDDSDLTETKAEASTPQSTPETPQETAFQKEAPEADPSLEDNFFDEEFDLDDSSSKAEISSETPASQADSEPVLKAAPQPVESTVKPASPMTQEKMVEIPKESGVISQGGGFVSIDQKGDRNELKGDLASLRDQQAELMARVQELQKIVSNLEPRLTATQTRLEGDLSQGGGSQQLIKEIETLKEEIVRLKNEVAILKNAPRTKHAKILRKTRPLKPVKSSPKAPEAYNKAIAAYKAGRYDESILLLQDLNGQNPPRDLRDNIHFWMGSNYMKLDMYDDAINHFQTILKKYPQGNKIHDARFMLGVCYQKKGDTGRALDVLDVALKSNPPSEVRKKIEKQLMEIK